MSTTLPYNPQKLSDAQASGKDGATHRSGATFPSQYQAGDARQLRSVKDLYLVYERLMRRVMGLHVEWIGGLNVGVAPGRYAKVDRTYVEFAGSAGYALPDDTTGWKLWIDVATNTLDDGTSWPVDQDNYVPLAYGNSASGAIDPESIEDALLFVACGLPGGASSPTGTSATAFVVDNDNAGAGADTALQFNRGTTAADAQLEWNETDDRFELEAELSGPTLAALNLLSILISGTTMLDANGAAKVAAAVAGDGLTHTAGVLSANVDDATIEIDTDTLQLKAGGVGTSHLADALADKLVQLSVGDASGASPRTVTIQALDAQGNNLGEVIYCEVLVCQDAEGAALATNATIADGGAGAVRYDKGSRMGLTAGKWLACKTDSSGTLEIEVTDGTSETVYLLVAMGERSRRMDCADYGTVVIS